MTASDVVALFQDPSGHSPDDPYLIFQAERIAYLCSLLDPYVTEVNDRRGGPARVLDIGPGHLTMALGHYFGDRISIDTLGFPGDPFVDHAGLPGRHIGFNLNDAQEPNRWVAADPHDIVVMAEVIEHLYTAPALVLGFVATLVDRGGVLVIQTPNAASLRKRVKLAIGRHPYEQIRETTANPGHFREYTIGELRSLCAAAGFEVEQAVLADYWSEAPIARARALARIQPVRGTFTLAASQLGRLVQAARPALRDGITIVARNRGS